MRATIYHNPKCATSRKVLDMLRAERIDLTVIEYLKHPPGRAELQRIIKTIGKGARGVLRKKGTPHDDLGLGEATLTDAELVDFMLAHPILIERPIVETEKGIRLGRPPESVREIL